MVLEINIHQNANKVKYIGNKEKDTDLFTYFYNNYKKEFGRILKEYRYYGGQKYYGETYDTIIKENQGYIEYMSNIKGREFLKGLLPLIEYYYGVDEDDDIIHFGQYKGQTFQGIYDYDFSYIKWLDENTKSDSIKRKLEEHIVRDEVKEKLWTLSISGELN